MIRRHLFFDVPMAATALTLAMDGVGGQALPLALMAGAVAALHSWAVVNPRSSLYLKLWWRLPVTETDLALTFDDGPHPEATPAILDLLAASGQRATFFLIGEHVQRHPDIVRRIRAEGHAVGLHSHTHSRWFNFWSPRRVCADLNDCAKAIADVTGEPPPRLFRPPVGLKSPIIADVVLALGLVPVTWSARAYDTLHGRSDLIARRLSAACRPGAILLLHDGHEPMHPADRSHCVRALSGIISHLGRTGLTSYPLGLGVPGVKLVKTDPGAAHLDWPARLSTLPPCLSLTAADPSLP